MKTKAIIILLTSAAALSATGGGLYYLGMKQGMQPPKESNASSMVKDEQRVLYWHDPMVPGHKFDKPGKSPFMDMQLVPMYADDGGSAGKVSINSQIQQNLGIRTAIVRLGTMAAGVDVVGNIVYNERDVAVVPARASGFLERLYVRATLDRVKKGQVLGELYVPSWVAAQEDYLAVRRMGAQAPEGLLDGARQRMRLAGMTDAQIAQVSTAGEVRRHLPLVAPISGVVSELMAQEGMTVDSGVSLFKINGLTKVWVDAEVPETQAALLAPGNTVEATTVARPDKVFRGQVAAILPQLNAATRTMTARVELANDQGFLVPGMFASIKIMPITSDKVLLIPSEAVIQTGTRNVVMLAEEGGKFAPVEVVIGQQSDGLTEVKSGLQAGQKVVSSGQFLVDSEASLKGVETRLGTAAPGASMEYEGSGRVEHIGAGELSLSHEPIAALQWGAMTMNFALPPGGIPANVASGDEVVFSFKETSPGRFQITSITPTAEPKQGMMGVVK